MKLCASCKKPKGFSEFHKSSVEYNKDGYRSKCKSCRKLERHKEYETAAIYRNADPIRNKAKNLTRFWPGTTWQQAWANYLNLLSKQNSSCAICGEKETAKCSKTGRIKKLAVDHEHKSKKVRGLLCDRCNRGLGFFKDMSKLCSKAAEYLENHIKSSK